jgi:phosphoglycerate dehydrogenase-like enzyme
MMKDGVVIINTARGAVMDEAALVDALESGKVASCGLDVYENEPKVHPGLVANEQVVLVPHMGTWTVEVSSNFLAIYPSSSVKLRECRVRIVEDLRCCNRIISTIHNMYLCTMGMETKVRLR